MYSTHRIPAEHKYMSNNPACPNCLAGRILNYEQRLRLHQHFHFGFTELTHS